MKSTDKFLIGIVGGVIVLVAVAFVLVFLRPEPTYEPEDTPEGVAHNYLLALQQEEYARAYGYLSPALKNYPASTEIFAEDVDDFSWRFRELRDGSTTLAIGSSRVVGERTVVSVQETTFQGRGLFDNNRYTHTFEMKLQLENGAWRIVTSDSYWAACWEDDDGCR